MSTVDDSLKKVVVTVTDELPYVGKILGLLIDILWSAIEGEDRIGWDEIRDEARRIADEEISEEVEERLAGVLEGLTNVMSDYCAAAAPDPKDNSSQQHLYANYVAARAALELAVPSFKEPKYRTQLLPRFVQAANLHLSLLRDASLFGADHMGMSEATVEGERLSLQERIDSYGAYVGSTVDEALAQAHIAKGELRSDLVLALTLKALDYRTVWQYWKPGAALPVGPILEREVFSRTFGQAPQDDETLQSPPQAGYYAPPPDGGRVTEIHLGWTRPMDQSPGVDCMSVHYDTGFNSGWMGSHSPVEHTTPIVTIDPHRPIKAISFTRFGIFEIPTGVVYVGEAAGAGILYDVPAGHYISSVNVKSKFYDDTRGMLYNDLVRLCWFGFRYDPML